LYVSPDLGATLDVAPTGEPTVLAGRGMGSGLGLSELAFLWGRHLSRLRPSSRAFSFFRSADELAQFVEAAAILGGAPGADARRLQADGKRLLTLLRADVHGADLDRLKAAAREFRIEDMKSRATRAMVRADLAGIRTGLLACGDVYVAAQLIDRFPTRGAASVEEQKGELYAFAISDAYGSLRQRLGVASAA
ncbi:MAG TPA: hypothetical protein VGL13_13905, partial [Polyangiaceae bacterium]